MNNQYTEKCCRHAWQQLCLPAINYNQNWSSEEDQLLQNLVQIHGAYADKWPLIALNFVSVILLVSYGSESKNSWIILRIVIS
jgi:hypothetical protein